MRNTILTLSVLGAALLAGGSAEAGRFGGARGGASHGAGISVAHGGGGGGAFRGGGAVRGGGVVRGGGFRGGEGFRGGAGWRGGAYIGPSYGYGAGYVDPCYDGYYDGCAAPVVVAPRVVVGPRFYGGGARYIRRGWR